MSHREEEFKQITSAIIDALQVMDQPQIKEKMKHGVGLGSQGVADLGEFGQPPLHFWFQSRGSSTYFNCGFPGDPRKSRDAIEAAATWFKEQYHHESAQVSERDRKYNFQLVSKISRIAFNFHVFSN